MKSMKISLKLPLFVALAVALCVATTIAFAYREAARQLVEAQSGKLVALRDARAEVIEDYLATIREDLVITASSPATAAALAEFEAAYGVFDDPVGALQRAYIAENPHPLGQKDALLAAEDGSAYAQVHRRWHPFFHGLQQGRGYYDVFLVDADGRVVYSVFKENDFATDLLTGPWKDSDLGAVFRRSQADPAATRVAFADFAPYEPSNGAAASFISSPIVVDGRFQGALIFQMPIDRINGIMQVSAGMGETGETYLVGEDLLMRSDSRFSQDSTILRQKVETESALAALAGEEGTGIMADYRGTPVLSSYERIEFEGVPFAVIAEIDEAEVLAPVETTRDRLLMIGLAVLLVLTALGIWFARSLVKPIAGMTGAMSRLAEGDLATDIPSVERGDEIGFMARSVLVFKESMLRTGRMEKEAQEAERRAEAEKKQAMATLADRFEASVGGIVEIVSSAATELESAAQTLNITLEETNTQAGTVAAAATQASSNVETVATACEELAASVREIGQQVDQSSRIAGRAVGSAEQTQATAQGLVAIVQVSQAASEGGSAATQVLSSAQDLSRSAANLRSEVAHFLTQVRAA